MSTSNSKGASDAPQNEPIEKSRSSSSSAEVVRKPGASSRFAQFALPPGHELDGAVAIPKGADLKKPGKTVFFRIHPTHEIRLSGFLGEARDLYFVMPELAGAPELTNLVAPYRLCRAIDLYGVEFVAWRREPDPLNANPWHQTLLELFEEAKGNWVRIGADMRQGFYRGYRANSQGTPAAWSDRPFDELLEEALAGKLIDSADHPVLKALRGESV